MLAKQGAEHRIGTIESLRSMIRGGGEKQEGIPGGIVSAAQASLVAK